MAANMAAASLRASRPLLVAAAKNGRVVPCDVDATAFLLSLPRGAYTGARTVQQTRVFDYEGHMKRLVDSTVAMHAAPLVPRQVEQVLVPRTEETLRAAMREFKAQFGSEEGEEYKINLLVCAAGEDGDTAAAEAETLLENTDVYCHIGLLPPLRSELVKLKVAGLPRHNATAKDSAWVRERKAIYDSLPPDVEEIVLMDPATRELLEGSQTNFYAIQGGTVHTASDGILNGTVRALVLDVCKKSGIPVVLSPPTLDTVDQWESCFISSTSRLVLGARELQFEDLETKQPRVKTFPPSTLLERISSLVRAAVLDKSSLVFDE